MPNCGHGLYAALSANCTADAPLQSVVDHHGHQRYGNPQTRVHGADLPQIISGYAAVIPDGVAAVYQQSGGKLHHSDDSGACQGSGEQRELWLNFTKMAHQQETQSARNEHTAVAATPPAQLHGNICAAAKVEKYRFFPDFQTNHLKSIIAKKIKKKAFDFI